MGLYICSPSKPSLRRGGNWLGGNALCTDELSLGGRPAGWPAHALSWPDDSLLQWPDAPWSWPDPAEWQWPDPDPGWPEWRWPDPGWRCYRLYNYA